MLFGISYRKQKETKNFFRDLILSGHLVENWSNVVV